MQCITYTVITIYEAVDYVSRILEIYHLSSPSIPLTVLYNAHGGRAPEHRCSRDICHPANTPTLFALATQRWIPTTVLFTLT